MIKLAERVGRLGTETAFEVLARVEALRAAGRSVINLSIGSPDFKTAPHIVEAACKALRDGHHGYTLANGILPLREAIAGDLERHTGVAVDPGQILVVPGGKMTIFFATLLFGEPGGEIIYPDPSFPIYRSAAEFSGAKAVPVELKEENGFAFKADDVLEKITPRTRLIIVNSPANPTGGVAPKAELDRLVAGLERHPHVALLSDEIYSRLVYDGRTHTSLLAYPSIRDRLVLLDGFSKTYAMTGWRLGYGVWPKALVESVVRLAVNSFSCVNSSAQYAGIAALTGPQDCVETMRQAFDERRRVLLTGLNQLPGVRCVDCHGAFFAMPNITATGFSSRELQDGLLERAGVATVSGTSFGIYGEGYLRFSYAADKAEIEEAVERMRKFLAAPARREALATASGGPALA